MKIESNFLRFQLTFFLGLIALLGNAQVSDSISYGNGYLHYHEYGSKELSPIIVLTGGPGNSYNQLEGLAEKLSEKFRVILPEQRGTGKSIPVPMDTTTMNLEAVTKDIGTLMKSFDLQKAVVLGHSWGGMLAMNFASNYPEKVAHLILVAPGPHKNTKHGFEILASNRNHTRSFEENQRLQELSRLIAVGEASDTDIIESKKLSRRAYIYSNPIPDSIFRLINSERNGVSASLLIKDVFKNYDVSNSLNQYQGKIDVISGRQDVVGFFSYELKLDISKTKLNWINKSGHFPMYEQPDEFYRILFNALDKK